MYIIFGWNLASNIVIIFLLPLELFSINNIIFYLVIVISKCFRTGVKILPRRFFNKFYLKMTYNKCIFTFLAKFNHQNHVTYQSIWKICTQFWREQYFSNFENTSSYNKSQHRKLLVLKVNFRKSLRCSTLNTNNIPKTIIILV